MSSGPMREVEQISRRRTTKINLTLGYARYTVVIANQLILVPLYLRFISIGAYGSWLASGNVVTLLNILDIGFSLVVTQRLATAFGAGDKDQFVQEAGSSLGIALGGFVFLNVAVFALSPWIPGWINAPPSETAGLRLAIELAGIGVACQVIGSTMWSVLQAWQLAFLCEFQLLISSILGVIATVVALFGGLGVVAFGVGAVVRGASAALLLIVVVALQWRSRKLPLPWIRLRGVTELFRDSSPVIVSRIILSFANDGQAVIVSACLNPTAAAILSLTSRAFMGCRTLLDPLTGSSFAGIAHLVGQSSPTSVRVRSVLRELFTITASCAALMFGMALALNVSFGHLWVGAGRFGDLKLTIVVCVAILMLFINNAQAVVVTALGDIRGPAWCSLLEVVLRVPLAVVLLLYMGIIGAPLAACVTSVAIGSWYLFRLLLRNQSLTAADTFRILSGGLPALVSCLFVSAAVGALLPPATTWLALIGRGGCLAIVLVTLILVLTPLARSKATHLAISLSSRYRKVFA